ncbi:vitamin K epoxide reductase family protein [Leptothoe kymatousa]|uniref:Vitamin K epoxide reductase family protein n=1 Tax=Leptothoe kymatousa TAU-MAC 1615 TaxID=2364775 RepID=A0ABS5XYU3_9CYAN|nr:vitamin K epoxide reductase family protein [Leptothoe kymatousa]MBT9310797.1 vitamin K epoxide reductase family protein [Leptothoe kymatousa TAU-MAC 1615]
MGRRRKENRGIYRWSRPAIGAIATVGALGTAYLTVIKLMGNSAACPVKGCDQVLTSAYADVFGIPLTLFGCLAYLTMGALSLGPLLINGDGNSKQRQQLEDTTWPLLFIGATGMMVFSGYLMYLLATELKAACLYCIASASFTLLMFILTLVGRQWEDQGALVFRGVIMGMVTLVATIGMYSISINGPSATAAGNTGPAVTNTSGEAEVALAKHLKEVDAKMYGAYWCPHCFDQKQLFGKEAKKYMPYIECADDGADSQTELCRSVPEISGFPTWEVNGQFLAGTQTLSTLAEASGYTGPKNFKN